MAIAQLPKATPLTKPVSRRTLLGGVGAGAAALALSGTTARRSFAQSKGEINVLYRTDDEQHFSKVIDAFTKATGIKVKYDKYPADYLTGQQMATTRLAAGDNTPDVFWCDDIQAAMYGAAGWLEPLDPVVKENKIDLSDWPQTILKDVSSWKGTLYRLPWGIDVEIFMYRTDYFKEAGVEPPTDWQGIVTVGQKLTKSPDRWGLALSGKNDGALTNDIQHWTNQAGGSEIALDNPGSKEALTFYKELFKKNNVAPPSTPQENTATILQGFSAGKYAMWWSWDAYYGLMVTDPKFWKNQVSAFVPLPKGPANNQTTIGCWGWAINANSKKKDLAKQWVAFTAQPDIMKFQMLYGHSPARSSLWSDAEYEKHAPQLAFLKKLSSTTNALKARPITPSFQEIDDAARQNVHAYLTDQIDLDTAVKRAMEKIKPLLEQDQK